MTTPTLSQGTLEVQRAPGRSGYNFDYRIHQLVADWFGDREGRGYLYRVVTSDPPSATVLVLSDVPPVENPPPRPWGRTLKVMSRDYDIELSRSQLVDFEIRLNATRVVTADNGSKSRRDIWDVVWEEDPEDDRSPDDVYGAYLARKLEGAATVQTARVTERGAIAPRRSGGRPMTVVAANVIGTLRVSDPSRLGLVIRNGIGRAKAFGCGLLCLSSPGTVLARRYGSNAAGLESPDS